MSTQQPTTGPAPDGPDGSQDDTRRLDPVPGPGAPTERLEAPATGPNDGATRVLLAEASGVDALWTLDRPADATPEPTDPAPTRAGRRPVRVGTVVWGLVVAVCGVLALAVAGGASVDGGTVAIGVLAGAGVALVAGSIVTGVRRRDRA
jgi:hypothetical protein